MTTKPSTASRAYEIQQKRVWDLLGAVTAKMATHADRQAHDPSNWGFVGDMEHYANLLEEFLGIEYRAEIDPENREVEVTRKADGATIVFTFDELSNASDLRAVAIEMAKTLAESCWG